MTKPSTAGLLACLVLAAGGAMGIACASEQTLPAGTRVLADLAYGQDSHQRFDVYIPPNARNAPVLFIVHGGGWRRGWKDHPGLLENKAAHWLPKGYILVSTDYRLMPEANPLEQARDVARSLAAAQERASSWGADPDRFVLMGHSAGGHLVALLGTDPALRASFGVRRPLGVVSLDSGAMDVVEIMQSPRRFRLYDTAFGTDPEFWRATSPYHALKSDALPMLAVCSTRRPGGCVQEHAMVRKAAKLGARLDVLPQDLSHMEVNRDLGLPGPYTRKVDAFIEGLLP